MRQPQGQSRSIRESEVVRAILDYCAVERIFCKRRNVGAVKLTHDTGKSRFVRFGEAGQVDLWGIVRGKHFECEVKRPGEKPTEAQLAWLKQCSDAGAFAFWCDSLDFFIKQIQVIRYGESSESTVKQTTDSRRST